MGGLERAVHVNTKGRRPPENQGTSGEAGREAAGPAKREEASLVGGETIGGFDSKYGGQQAFPK